MENSIEQIARLADKLWANPETQSHARQAQAIIDDMFGKPKITATYSKPDFELGQDDEYELIKAIRNEFYMYLAKEKHYNPQECVVEICAKYEQKDVDTDTNVMISYKNPRCGDLRNSINVHAWGWVVKTNKEN